MVCRFCRLDEKQAAQGGLLSCEVSCSAAFEAASFAATPRQLPSRYAQLRWTRS
jgi:hypothetical protein